MHHQQDDSNLPLENSRFQEMKSIQPYSTKDEYIYAMKEDLAEWFNSMYSTHLNVLNFIEQLETGALICHHANNVMRAAIETHKFNQSDLINAGIINIPITSIKNPNPKQNLNINKIPLTPNGKSAWAGDYLLYKSDAKPQSFQSRDNISNFIKWCRFIAKVRECLMFETDDLILRKNEKNFILCLLEVARFGSKFGIQVPTIIKLEQEIEAEIEREIEASQSNKVKIEAPTIEQPVLIKILSPKKEEEIKVEKTELEINKEINIYVNDDDLANNKNEINLLINQIGNNLVKSKKLKEQLSITDSLCISVKQDDDIKLNSNGSFDSSSLDDSFDDLISNCADSAEINNDNSKTNKFDDSLDDFNFIPIDDDEDLNDKNSKSPKSQRDPFVNSLKIDLRNNNNSNINQINDNLKQDDEKQIQIELQIDLDLNQMSKSNSNTSFSNNSSNLINNSNNTNCTSTTNENSPLIPSPLSTSVSSSNSSLFATTIQQNELNHSSNNNRNLLHDSLIVDNNNCTKFDLKDSLILENSFNDSFNQKLDLNNLNQLEQNVLAKPNHKVIKNLSELYPKTAQNTKENSLKLLHDDSKCFKPIRATTLRSRSESIEQIDSFNNKQIESNKIINPIINNTQTVNTDNKISLTQEQYDLANNSQTNLHKHVCKIADRCTCEKQFPVIKIGEGKYRIGNTKNIVFIRILRSHIMVRVGGGWDTLENYLNKHDPCRCPSDIASYFYSGSRKHQNSSNDTCSSNILLTPVNSQLNSNSNTTHSSISNNPFLKYQSKSVQKQSLNNCNQHPQKEPIKSVDFTDAKLVVERDTQGKHIIGKILLISQADEPQTIHHSSSGLLNKSFSSSNSLNLNIATSNNNNNNNINNNSNISNINKQQIYASSINQAEEMNGLLKTNLYTTPLKHNISNQNEQKKQNFNQNTSQQNQFQSQFKQTNSISVSNSSNSINLNSTKLLNHSISNNGSTNSKTDTSIKSKMKKIINRLPSNPQTPVDSERKQLNLNNNNNSTIQYSNKNQIQHPSVLKFNRTISNEPNANIISTITTTTGYSSLNDDSSSDFLENTPIYTETKLPPRILKKYEKKRACTEAIVQTQETDNGESMHKLLIETGSSSGSGLSSPKQEEFVQVQKISSSTNTSSPKAPPRNKKKYRKSKTTDISRYQKNSHENAEDSLESEHYYDDDEEDDDEEVNFNKKTDNCSLNSSNKSTTNKNFSMEIIKQEDYIISHQILSPILKSEKMILNIDEEYSEQDELFESKLNKLNDSLESLNEKNHIHKESRDLTFNNDNKIEDDSLLNNQNENNIRISLSSNSSANDSNNEQANSSASKRAQWDKSRQAVDYKSQIATYKPTTKPKPLLKNNIVAHLSSPLTNPSVSYERRDSSSSSVASKKARNLNLAKEKLYEMKKTIDAKINLESLDKTPKLIPTQINQITSNTNTRTTPRKVKKRSGERSVTTGLFQDTELELKPKEVITVKKYQSQSRPTTPGLTRQENKVKPTNQKMMSYKQQSSSLHNLTNFSLQNDQNRLMTATNHLSRARRDSSTASSRTCLSSHNNSYMSATPNEFKENKAYELRKKSTLMNKIIVKTQQNDPIYSRSHPICTEIIEQQTLNVTSDNISNYSCESTARKRLFAKKNEKPFDPNMSIGSNGSSNSIPVYSQQQSKIRQAPASPVVNKTKLINTISSKRSSPIKTNPTQSNKPPSRSKSNNDLYYELERTNSTQDLLELINDCEPPQGDMHKYKLLLSECENYDPKIKKSKNIKNLKSNAQNNNNNKQINDARDLKNINDKNINQKCRQGSHRRSRSLPSYASIPIINITNDVGIKKDVQ